MDAVLLLAKSSDDLVGLIGFCLLAALVVFIILAKAIASVSPEAMARKIREMQGLRQPGTARPVAPTFEEPVLAEVVEPPIAQLPRRKKKRRHVAPLPSASGPRRQVADVQAPVRKTASTSTEGSISLQQAVIYSEVLGPPLALRRGRGGLLRSAPWIR